MKMDRMLVSILLLLGLMFWYFPEGVSASQSCSGCHPSMKPYTLPDSPPADLLLALTTPCFQYGRLLQEWYYVEELFVTTEHHIEILEGERYHVEPLRSQLVASREFYNESIKEPVTSLAGFQQITGKLRFDVGKVYRDAKAKRIEYKSRSVFGFILIGTIFILFLIITGWRVAAGSGEVHPTKTKLGYDDLKEREAKEKEIAE